jgi:hypothetical protein
MGSLSPIISLNAKISSGAASSPSIKVAGSPGIILIRKNTRVTTIINTGITDNNRFIMNLIKGSSPFLILSQKDGGMNHPSTINAHHQSVK